jgi:16S rRNA (cytosine1402-N4)-methyltransferase
VQTSSYHRPVLLDETLALLAPRDGGEYFDGTLGGGGHAEAILAAAAPTGVLHATDLDAEALASAEQRLRGAGDRLRVARAGFDELDTIEAWRGVLFDGAVLDLGVSSHQLETARRGFAFDLDAPLDMRMGSDGPTAADLLNDRPVPELARILRRYGEEPFAGPIARAVGEARARRRIETSARFKEILRDAVPRSFSPVKVYARAFQALRIAVNDELGRLERGLGAVFERLRPGGRLVVLSYHSLEDRIVKEAFRGLANPCVCPPGLPVCGCGRVPRARLLTPRAVTASPKEVGSNPRARSARLRAVERLPAPSLEQVPDPTPAPQEDRTR